MSRLAPQPGERVNRARVISFEFDGKPVQGFEGDTIGSALYASGQRVFSRSFKYHRRRGLLCCAGQCPNCLVAVDGAPGVRACTEPLREGMRVEHMNASPSLDFDLMAVTDRVGSRFTPPGFYYKTFMWPRRLWPLYERVLRNAAGLGRLGRASREEREWRTEYRRRHCDVLVVGAGEAGLTAAIEAAESGADVVLVDEGPEPGGWLLVCGEVERARQLAERARAAGVEILSNAPALGYFDGLVPVWQDSTLHQIRAQRHIFATGSIEQPLVFENNDLPGVMLSTAVRRLISLYGVRPGTKAVVANDTGIADVLRAAGVDVHVAEATVVKAKGRRAVTAAVLSNGDTIPCDLLVVSGGFAPANSLVRQAGANAEAVGELAECTPATCDVRPAAGKAFVCLCEDVTAKDFKLSVAEGYDTAELSKRYTTTTMGPCQGRMCQCAAERLIAEETGQSPEAVGTTTARPPWSTVPLGALAGRPFEPAKRTPIHARQREQGASMLWAGDWRRAYDYGDPQGEALAVHESAGLIDVSTLGKLIVRGPDAGEFLDRLYPNRFSNLRPGRVRYGVLTSDAGRITDDGTVCRLDDETFYVTTTSSGAGAVEQWFAWWLADWRMDVTLTDVTQGLAAVNLAGPRAREIMSRLTDLDVSGEAFPYLDGQRGRVAGAPSLILRIGFVGELGYEIHFPSAYGEDVWNKILEAGADYGIRPFGLEPQRILRLQKMHILVGQDTDSESNPYGAAMPWIVKLDKEEDFIGKWALERAVQSPQETALVGFTLPNGHVPTEGAVVLNQDGGPMGQVTSARHSRQLGRTIGMAWVPAHLAEDGAGIVISDEGRTLDAEVVTRPFFDPDGEVLRS
ncbi:MAG TPA: 2Fe-2S iron-sulfur cluster-binding protein [Thermoleophilaceae bacterium]